ncbi:MAG: hypothetical protein QOD50_1551 [Actinomycetota bacterium]|nr:hypothetical protein [Actinomycetota bacterium]
MIDEAVLEDLLAQLGDEITVPADGPHRIVDGFGSGSKPTARHRSSYLKPLVVAAAVVALIAITVPILQTSSSSEKRASTAAAPALTPPSVSMGRSDVPGTPTGGTHASVGAGSPGTNATQNGTSGGGAPGPLDAPKLVKTGTLDLQVPHAGLRLAVNRVTGVTVGLGGYVADSKTNYGGTAPTAQVTVRVPVADFETAIARLDALPGVTVLDDSESGADVTGQYTDLQAQLQAATGERDALLVVLSRAQSIGDILAVRDRVSSAQTEVDQLHGRIDVLNGQATFSSVAVTLSEKPARVAPVAVHHPKPETGLAKSWSDARRGFANAIEWLIARSGGALIILLAGLALLFGIRYLYPIVRRGLV